VIRELKESTCKLNGTVRIIFSRINKLQKVSWFISKFETFSTVISGSNGTGKTQIIWAITLFLRAYNSRSKDSAHSKNTTLSLSSQHLFEVLAHPYFQNATIFDNFLNDSEKNATIAAQIYNQKKFEFQIKPNGELKFILPLYNVQEKIHYALVTSTFLFCNSKDEKIGILELLTTSQQNLR
jgi:hypothetical protein